MAFKTLQLVPEKPPTWWQGLLVGATSLAGAVVARLAVLPIVHHGAPFLTFFPAVMAASVWGGRLGGLFVLAAAPLAILIERGFTVQNPSFEAGAVEVFLLAGGLMVWLGDALSRSVREVYAARGRDAEAQLQAVIRELGHRARNGFAVVMALTDQSARSATSVEDYRNRLLARLSALSASQDLITRARGAPVSLRDLFRGILDPFDLDRFAWPPQDHDCQVDPETALALALVFHELATNALKYGSLSVEAGRVVIGCTLGPQSARTVWTEEGGPPCAPPQVQGAGTRLLRTAIQQVGGETEIDFDPDGLRCTVEFRIIDGVRDSVGRPSPPPLRIAAE